VFIRDVLARKHLPTKEFEDLEGGSKKKVSLYCKTKKAIPFPSAPSRGLTGEKVITSYRGLNRPGRTHTTHIFFLKKGVANPVASIVGGG